MENIKNIRAINFEEKLYRLVKDLGTEWLVQSKNRTKKIKKSESFLEHYTWTRNQPSPIPIPEGMVHVIRDSTDSE